jgi:hypothetical protein
MVYEYNQWHRKKRDLYCADYLDELAGQKKKNEERKDISMNNKC